MSYLFTNIQSILACPMCMSGAEGNTLIAANAAIGALFVILVGVLASFFSFIIYLAKRSKKYQLEPVPVEVSPDDRRKS